MNRYEKFKQLRGACEPTASDTTQAYFVDRPGGGAGRAIAESLTLAPYAHHHLASAIGGGKSSEMRFAMAQLNKQNPDVFTVWMDPTEHRHPFNDMGPNWLVEWVLHALVTTAETQGRLTSERIRALVAPFLTVPSARPLGQAQSNFTASHVLGELVRHLHTPVTVFVDSIDRYDDSETLQNVFANDLFVLSRLEVGLVCPVPLKWYLAPRDHGQGLSAMTVHFVRPAQLSAPAERDWLEQVVRQRDIHQLVDDMACQRLVQISGGIVRFLVQLMGIATERAYAAGQDKVTAQSVGAAIGQFAQSSLVAGLRASDTEQLRRWQNGTLSTASITHFAEHVNLGRILLASADPGSATLHPMLLELFESRAA
ncbi:MAG: hypothetical protein Q8Q09_10400 [Deltaproteobacteria bacterium]|nr:hypothetical protein [Deltaproteobacteria bacterium]